MIIELIQIIHRRAKQARPLLEIQAQKPIQPEATISEPPKQFRNEYGGPWSNAMKEKYEKALHEKYGIKMRPEYDDSG